MPELFKILGSSITIQMYEGLSHEIEQILTT
jgi:hypothetical protein